MSKVEPIWLENFKKHLKASGIEPYVPDKVITYLQGIFDGFTRKISELRDKLEKTENKNKELLKIIDKQAEEYGSLKHEYEKLVAKFPVEAVA